MAAFSFHGRLVFSAALFITFLATCGAVDIKIGLILENSTFSDQEEWVVRTAVEHANTNSFSLSNGPEHNIELVSIHHLDCSDDNTAANNLANELALTVDVVIGPPCSGHMKITAPILASSGVLSLGYSTTDPELADVVSYPMFLRLCGTERLYAVALRKLVHFGKWQRVAVIADSSWASQSIELLKEEMPGIIETTHFPKVAGDVRAAVSDLHDRFIRVIVLYFTPPTGKTILSAILQELYDQGMYGEGFVFIVLLDDDYAQEAGQHDFRAVLQGAIGVTPRLDNDEADVIQRIYFDAPSNGESHQEHKLRDSSLFFYDAVATVSHALHSASDLQLSAADVTATRLNQIMRANTFVGTTGILKWTNGDNDRNAEDLVLKATNCVQNAMIDVGVFGKSILYLSNVIWPGEQSEIPSARTTQLGACVYTTDGNTHVSAFLEFAIRYVNDQRIVPGGDVLMLDKDNILDCGCNPQQASSQAEKLHSLGTKIVLGTTCSSSTIALYKRFDEIGADIALYGQGAATSVLADSDLFPKFVYITVTTASSSQACVRMLRASHVRHIAMVAQDDAWGQDALKQMVKRCSETGIAIGFVALIPFDGREVSQPTRQLLKETMAQIAEMDIDYVVIFLQTNQMDVVAELSHQAARTPEMRYPKIISLGDQCADYAAGSLCLLSGECGPECETDQFHEDFNSWWMKSRPNEVIPHADLLPRQSVDMLRIVAVSVHAAKSLSVSFTARELTELSRKVEITEGWSGHIKFPTFGNSRNSPIKNAISVIQKQDGEDVHTVDKIVISGDAATINFTDAVRELFQTSAGGCSPGTQTPAIAGETTCTPCSPGTWSPGGSDATCRPCDSDSICPFASMIPLPKGALQFVPERHPLALGSTLADEQWQIIFQAFVSVLIFITFVLPVCAIIIYKCAGARRRRHSHFFKSIDFLFNTAHVPDVGVKLQVRQTTLGGIFTVFSILYAIVALCYITTMAIIDNVAIAQTFQVGFGSFKPTAEARTVSIDAEFIGSDSTALCALPNFCCINGQRDCVDGFDLVPLSATSTVTCERNLQKSSCRMRFTIHSDSYLIPTATSLNFSIPSRVHAISWNVTTRPWGDDGFNSGDFFVGDIISAPEGSVLTGTNATRIQIALQPSEAVDLEQASKAGYVPFIMTTATGSLLSSELSYYDHGALAKVELDLTRPESLIQYRQFYKFNSTFLLIATQMISIVGGIIAAFAAVLRGVEFVYYYGRSRRGIESWWTGAASHSCSKSNEMLFLGNDALSAVDAPRTKSDPHDPQTIETGEPTNGSVMSRDTIVQQVNKLTHVAVRDVAREATAVRDVAREATAVRDVAREATAVRDVAREATAVKDVAREATAVRDMARESTRRRLHVTPTTVAQHGGISPRQSSDISQSIRRGDEAEMDSETLVLC